MSAYIFYELMIYQSKGKDDLHWPQNSRHHESHSQSLACPEEANKWAEGACIHGEEEEIENDGHNVLEQ